MPRKWRRRAGIGKGQGASGCVNRRIQLDRFMHQDLDWYPPPWNFRGYVGPRPKEFMDATPFGRLSDDEGYSTLDSESDQEERRAADRRLNDDPATNFQDIPYPIMCQKAVPNGNMEKLVESDRRNRGQSGVHERNTPLRDLRSFEYAGEIHMEACQYERIVSWLSTVQADFAPDEDEDEEALFCHSPSRASVDNANVPAIVRDTWPTFECEKLSHRENKTLCHLSAEDESVTNVSYADFEYKLELDSSENSAMANVGDCSMSLAPGRISSAIDHTGRHSPSDNHFLVNCGEADKSSDMYPRPNMESKTEQDLVEMKKKKQSYQKTHKSQVKSIKATFSRLKHSLSVNINRCSCFGSDMNNYGVN